MEFLNSILKLARFESVPKVVVQNSGSRETENGFLWAFFLNFFDENGLFPKFFLTKTIFCDDCQSLFDVGGELFRCKGENVVYSVAKHFRS
jgi:DNA gyrase inhibitor GyrI